MAAFTQSKNAAMVDGNPDAITLPFPLERHFHRPNSPFTLVMHVCASTKGLHAPFRIRRSGCAYFSVSLLF